MSDSKEVIDFFEIAEGGVIIASMRASRETFVVMTLAGRNLREGFADPAKHWFSDDEVMERPANPSVVSGQLISNIPFGSFVSVLDVRERCEDGQVEFAFEDTGNYSILVESWPHLTARFEIEIKDTDTV